MPTHFSLVGKPSWFLVYQCWSQLAHSLGCLICLGFWVWEAISCPSVARLTPAVAVLVVSSTSGTTSVTRVAIYVLLCRAHSCFVLKELSSCHTLEVCSTQPNLFGKKFYSLFWVQDGPQSPVPTQPTWYGRRGKERAAVHSSPWPFPTWWWMNIYIYAFNKCINQTAIC